MVDKDPRLRLSDQERTDIAHALEKAIGVEADPERATRLYNLLGRVRNPKKGRLKHLELEEELLPAFAKGIVRDLQKRISELEEELGKRPRKGAGDGSLTSR